MSDCPDRAHHHRWLRFHPDGRKDETLVLVGGDGLVRCSEQAMEQLLRSAGYLLADPDATEISTMRLLAAARSRLLAALPGRAGR